MFRKLLVALASLMFLTFSTSFSCTPGPGNLRRVAIVGDSITFLSSRVLTEALSPPWQVEIAAVSGARTDQMQAAAEDLATRDPGHAVINLGTNDIAELIPMPDIETRYVALIGAFPHARCIYGVTLTEVTPKPEYNASAVEFNAWLHTQSVRVIEWADYIKTHPDEQVTEDFIHPSEYGKHVLANLTKTALEACTR